MPRRKTEALAQAVLDAEAAQLRAAGKTYRQIADLQNCSLGAAHDRVARAIAAVPVEAVEQLRKVELERLDLMYQAALGVLKRRHVTVSHGKLVYDPETEQPLEDDAPVLQAITSMLKVQERRAKLLGLDAPTQSRVEIITEDMVDAEIRRLEAELGRSGAPSQTAEAR